MSSKYLDKTAIQKLIEHRDNIYAEHKTAYDSFEIDILANDTLSSLSIWEIVSQYDADYNINFHRNGEDAVSAGILIEQKCSTVKPSKKKNTVGKAGFQFHAQGKLEYPRYIFAVRRKDNLQLVRLWDVSSDTGVMLVQEVLQAGKQTWVNKGKPNHDAIVVHEKNLLCLPVNETLHINECEVFKV